MTGCQRTRQAVRADSQCTRYVVKRQFVKRQYAGFIAKCRIMMHNKANCQRSDCLVKWQVVKLMIVKGQSCQAACC